MSTPLWLAPDLLEATGGSLSLPFDATGVSIDTRTLTRGDLFVALIGDGRDGHAFVQDAFAKGAAGAMVHATVTCDGPLLRVDDTLAGLTRLGGFARSRLDEASAKVVAITGSVGKTSTKEMLRGVLSGFGDTHAAVASYNNHWGVPLTLARTPRDAGFLILEIGMNHTGEIGPLARLARPHVAVITTIARAHIGHLGSIEAIADEKASLMRGLEPGGVAVLPADSDQLGRLRAAVGQARVVTFGADAFADVRLVHREADADGSLIHVDIVGRTVSFHLRAPGQHMAMNAVATLAAMAALGLDPSQGIEALERFVPLAGRGARRELAWGSGSVMMLDESYNANSASVQAALEVLRLQPARRRVAVLGDMLELGEEGPAEHRGLAHALIGSVDSLFCCGPLMRNLFEAVPAKLRGHHAPDAAALSRIVANEIRRGDAVLVKGSLGSGMKRVVEAIELAAARPVTASGGVG